MRRAVQRCALSELFMPQFSVSFAELQLLEVLRHSLLGIRLGGQAGSKVLRLLRPQLVRHSGRAQRSRQRAQLRLALHLQHNLTEEGAVVRALSMCTTHSRALRMLSSLSGLQ